MRIKQQNRKYNWQKIFGLALLMHVCGTIIRWTAPDLLSKDQVWLLASAVLILKLCLDIPKNARQYIQARREGASLMQALLHLVPQEVIGMFRLERATQRAFILFLCRKNIDSNTIPGVKFGFYQTSQYATIFIIVMICCATEVPLSYLLMGALVKDPAAAQYTHWALLATVFYSIILLLGDRYLLKSSHHLVGSDEIHLRVGARFFAQIPKAAVKQAALINSTKELSEAKSKWLQRNGFDPEETVIGTPIDTPNVALIIEHSASVKIEKYCVPRHGVRNVLIYVDDPAAFIQSIGKSAVSNMGVSGRAAFI